MICYTCNLTSICKVFEMSKSMSATINIVVNNCLIREGHEQIEAAPQPQQVSNVPVRTPDQLIAISDRIKEATKKTDDATELADKAVEKLTVACSDCRKSVFVSTAVRCTRCENYTCENCVTHDMTSKKPYCETCWGKQDPAPLI